MAKRRLEPTVTIGGAPAGYKPETTLQSTATLGGAPAVYRQVTTPNYITGAGVPGVSPAPQVPQATPYRGFRAAEDESNIGAPVYTPSSLTQTGEFIEEDENKRNTEDATQRLLLERQIAAEEEADRRDRQSAYDILYNEFNKYGLGSLVEDIKYLLQSNVSPSQFALELQNTKAYQQRFSANQNRIKSGLRALTPAEYIGLEDQYQNIMRNYGLPASYYTKDTTGKQSGFDKFLEGDVSASELEDRIITAQDRVLKSNPEVLNTLKAFYGSTITNGDILAYTLDPQNALKDIQRKVTAAEIGGAATAAGLSIGKTAEEIAASEARAQMLAGYGVTKQAAMTGFQTVADIAPRGGELAAFYNRPTYGQMEAEQEVFNLEGAAAARKKRQQLTALEQASFSGSSGASQGALSRDRAGNI
jgi:hypothetical protein